MTPAITSEWIDELATVVDQADRRRLLRQHASHLDVDRLYQRVMQLARTDLDGAARLALSLDCLAAELRDDRADALAKRASANVLYLHRSYTAALELYEKSLAGFEQLSNEMEIARTIVSMLQSLIYLSHYDRAFHLVERAQRILAQSGDSLRLARLHNNLGNIYYRQDRFAEALSVYQRTYEYFVEHGHSEDAGITLRNIAVCHISLGDFDRALASYQLARKYCSEHGLPFMVVESDYNIAYLHYIRGQYTRAIDLYNATRILCEKVRDPYHRALCDLDQSELYVELNLIEEALDLSLRAYRGFRRLGMGYESAKALVFYALASRQSGQSPHALKYFDRARAIFVAESNGLWAALIDLYKAMVLFEMSAFDRARNLCRSALDFFSLRPLPGKAAICELLFSRLALAAGQLDEATMWCDRATLRLRANELPALLFQAHMLAGEVCEARGRIDEAYAAFERAHEMLERLRVELNADDLKVAFLKDKLAVYESLVSLAVERRTQIDTEAAFDFIERAKSRSLADLIAFQVQALPAIGKEARSIADELRTSQEHLAWAQRQSEREELGTHASPSIRVSELQAKAALFGQQLTAAAARLKQTGDELAMLLHAGTTSLPSIREHLPEGSVILEYFEARGKLYGCVLGKRSLSITPLSDAAEVRRQLSFLQFQLSKFRLGADYQREFGPNLLVATAAHLQRLYDLLIAPVRSDLQAEHLVVVPHRFLHHLPFHALTNGGRALIEDFSISYAPSASVYHLASLKQALTEGASLVVGVADRLAPHIQTETTRVAAELPHARLLVGNDATQAALDELAPASRFIHIATHGRFRQDNPMFSSIRLANTDLTLFEMYKLRLSAELVTLSGCGTGLSISVGGDELLGMVRGLLYAGAQSILVTLWDVNDESTAELMADFYRRLAKGVSKARALREAMRDLRQRLPHPYFWAPFVLVGKA